MTDQLDSEFDDLSTLDGLTMVDAIQTYVLNDPEVLKHRAEFGALCDNYEKIAKTGTIYDRGVFWHLVDDPSERLDRIVGSVSEYEWEQGPTDDFGWGKPIIPKGPVVDRFAYALDSAFKRLIRPLSNGALVAKDGESEKEIPKTLFKAVGYWLDISKGDLGRGDEVVFRSLFLNLPVFETELEDPSADASAKAKSKGGRPSEHAWDTAFEELVIKLGEEGLPDTGSELADWYLDAFETLQNRAPNKDQAEKHLRENYKRLWSHVRKKA